MDGRKFFKTYIYIAGITVLMWDMVFVTRIFVMAYLSPSKMYVMNIDAYGEAFYELLFILCLLPFGIYVGISKIKEVIYNE